MEDIDKQLTEIVGKKNVLKNELMSKHTSFRIGGPADYFVKVESLENLKSILELSKKNNLPITLVGNGTNLLVRDAGIRGIVLKLEMKDFKIKKTASKILFTVDAGLALPTLAQIAIKEEIAGLEFLCGIPGTIGGALRMNAGAYGSEMKDIVTKSRYMTYDGKIKTLNNNDHKFEYRNSIFSKMNVIILDTTLELTKGSKKDIEDKIAEMSKSRKEKQPLEYPSAGSSFKRGNGFLTAKLIDDAGLKGYSIGDAEISTKHAGFIINKGKATANDVLKLVEFVKVTLKKLYDVDVEMEIIVLGDEK